jgi:hypothetical protein
MADGGSEKALGILNHQDTVFGFWSCKKLLTLRSAIRHPQS